MAETLVVFNDIKDWQVPLVSSRGFLSVPRLNLNLQQKLPEDVEKKQAAIVGKLYKAKFDKEFFAMSNAHFKSIQTIVDTIEETIAAAKKKGDQTKESLEKMVGDANAKLKTEVGKWMPKVEALHDKHYAKALAASDVEMKKKVKRAKVKAVLVAVLVVGLALTAAALTIAAAASGVGVAAIVIAAIVVAVGGIAKLHAAFKSSWQLCQDKMAEINAEIAKNEAIFTELTKLKARNDTSLLARANAFKEQVLLGSANIEKHVGQLEKFVHDLNTKLKDYKARLAELEKQSAELKKAGQAAASQDAQVAELKKLVAEMEKRIEMVNEVREAAAEITQRIKEDKIPDYPRLRKALDAFGQISAIVTAVAASLKSIIGSAKKLKAA